MVGQSDYLQVVGCRLQHDVCSAQKLCICPSCWSQWYVKRTAVREVICYKPKVRTTQSTAPREKRLDMPGTAKHGVYVVEAQL